LTFPLGEMGAIQPRQHMRLIVRSACLFRPTPKRRAPTVAAVDTITGAQAVRAALDTSVDPVPDAAAGVAWLRAHVARFSTGEDHRRRRALAVAELSRVDPDELGRRAAQRGGHPVEVLADALALPVRLEDVDLVAASYQPHSPLAPGADEAVSRLIEACGGTPDEDTAARIGLLVQACAATVELVHAAEERGGDGDDSVPRPHTVSCRRTSTAAGVRRPKRVCGAHAP